MHGHLNSVAAQERTAGLHRAAGASRATRKADRARPAAREPGRFARFVRPRRVTPPAPAPNHGAY
jgi:hypothetical protein